MNKSLLEIKYFLLQICFMGYTCKAQSLGKSDLKTELHVCIRLLILANRYLFLCLHEDTKLFLLFIVHHSGLHSQT